VLISERRLQKAAVILKLATVITFHKALVKRTYSRLYSNKTIRAPGRKPQDQTLFDLVIEMKSRNPSFGYGRISMQILEAFGISISRFTVKTPKGMAYENPPSKRIALLEEYSWNFRCGGLCQLLVAA
jgi:hypothetical protein